MKKLVLLASAMAGLMALTVGFMASAKGDTLVFGRGGDSVSLDSSDITDGESLRVTRQIYDSLLGYEEKTTAVRPALATKWTVSKDGLTYTFDLRKGVKFHDGTDFNADAVVFNFERWGDKKNPYHNGEFEYYGNTFGGYPGIIKSVTAVDKDTVKFSLSQRNAPFLANLAMASFAIESPAAIKKYKDEYGRHPVGTGAYKFSSWTKGEKIVLEANDDWWGGKAKLDKVIFRVIPENSARLMELQAGNVDLIDGVNPDDVALVKKDPSLQLFLRPSFNIGYLSMNFNKKPFDNVLVRQAVNMAINKTALVYAFYAGLAKVAKNPMPPSLWGYNDDVKDYAYNPAKAKELLAKAGFPKGFKTTLWAMPVARPYMPQPAKIAEALQADLKAVGIDAKIVSYDWGTYLDKTSNGEHDMALLGWTGDNGDPDNFLYLLCDKDNAVPPTALNISFYKSDALHDVLIKAQQETDQAERVKLYEKAQVIIKDDAPMVTLVHSTPPLAAVKNLKGYYPHPAQAESLAKVYFAK